MSAVWDRTSEFLGDNFAAVAGIAALAILVPGAIAQSLLPYGEGAGPGVRWGLLALWLVASLIAMWGQLAIAALAIAPGAGSASARATATRRFPALIAVALALIALTIVLAAPMLIVLLANGVDPTKFGAIGEQTGLAPGALAFVVLYLLFVFLPAALFMAARLAVLSTPVVAAEPQALGALRRAWTLSRGLTWRIIGVILLYGIVANVAALAAKTVFGALFALLLRGDGQAPVAATLTVVVVMLVATIFSVIGAAFPAKLYLAAREREGVATA